MVSGPSLMSASGQKPTNRRSENPPMSAVIPIADKPGRGRIVRFVPKAGMPKQASESHQRHRKQGYDFMQRCRSSLLGPHGPHGPYENMM